MTAREAFPYRGYCSIWNEVHVPHKRGGFETVIRPGAFDLSQPIKMLVNHDRHANITLASTEKGELELWPDDYGLACAFRIRPGNGDTVQRWLRQHWVNGLSAGYTATGYRMLAGNIEEIYKARITEISLVHTPGLYLTRAWCRDDQFLLPALKQLNRRWLNNGQLTVLCE